MLNPGGVRIGTAEIYRQVEQLDEVVESLVDRPGLAAGKPTTCASCSSCACAKACTLDDGAHRENQAADPRRTRRRATCPAKVVQVTDIPRTKSGKIVELAVRNVVHGQPVKNLEALANPEALAQFKDREELAT